MATGVHLNRSTKRRASLLDPAPSGSPIHPRPNSPLDWLQLRRPIGKPANRSSSDSRKHLLFPIRNSTLAFDSDRRPIAQPGIRVLGSVRHRRRPESDPLISLVDPGSAGVLCCRSRIRLPRIDGVPANAWKKARGMESEPPTRDSAARLHMEVGHNRPAGVRALPNQSACCRSVCRGNSVRGKLLRGNGLLGKHACRSLWSRCCGQLLQYSGNPLAMADAETSSALDGGRHRPRPLVGHASAIRSRLKRGQGFAASPPPNLSSQPKQLG